MLLQLRNPPRVLLEANASDPENLGLALSHESCSRRQVLPGVYPRAAKKNLLGRRNESHSHLKRLPPTGKVRAGDGDSLSWGALHAIEAMAPLAVKNKTTPAKLTPLPAAVECHTKQQLLLLAHTDVLYSYFVLSEVFDNLGALAAVRDSKISSLR